MAYPTEHTNTSKETVLKAGPPFTRKIDLLDLLDEEFLPKDRVKVQRRGSVSILDVMESPELVLRRIAEAKHREVEARKKKSMDLLDFLDRRTYRPKKDGEDQDTKPYGTSILDVMDPPLRYSENSSKEAVDLISLLDEKTRLPRNSRRMSGRHRINLLELLERPSK
ncbi:hypothetical protein IV203_001083 [Nitzschia inconspicua]|uniref:Uncharacterized protein n=1 Tax=Nitzschia inconspicua TaxID=303405 RepID=A0A9K3PQU9_9STRA|nr:hypothetical protein IV203_001083 [Nitzschia inconspicua]